MTTCLFRACIRSLFVLPLVMVPLNVRAEALPDTAGWESELVLGASLTDGNTENTLVKAGVATLKRKGLNEFKADAEYNFGESTVTTGAGESVDEKTAENAKAKAQANRLFSDRAYGYVLANGLYDDIAAIDYRVTVGPGAGAYLVKQPTTWIKAELGPSMLFEDVGGEQDESLLLRAAESMEYKTQAGARLWQSAEYLPQVDDFDRYLVNAELGVESALTPTLNLRLVASDRYDSQPAAGLERNDLSVTAAVVCKL